MLTKQVHSLATTADSDTRGGIVNFQQTADEPFEFIHRFVMRREDWDDMGMPAILTITVEPGDLLNTEA
jgi:hypothetical protein